MTVGLDETINPPPHSSVLSLRATAVGTDAVIDITFEILDGAAVRMLNPAATNQGVTIFSTRIDHPGQFEPTGAAFPVQFSVRGVAREHGQTQFFCLWRLQLP